MDELDELPPSLPSLLRQVSASYREGLITAEDRSKIKTRLLSTDAQLSEASNDLELALSKGRIVKTSHFEYLDHFIFSKCCSFLEPWDLAPLANCSSRMYKSAVRATAWKQFWTQKFSSSVLCPTKLLIWLSAEAHGILALGATDEDSSLEGLRLRLSVWRTRSCLASNCTPSVCAETGPAAHSDRARPGVLGKTRQRVAWEEEQGGEQEESKEKEICASVLTPLGMSPYYVSWTLARECLHHLGKNSMTRVHRMKTAQQSVRKRVARQTQKPAFTGFEMVIAWLAGNGLEKACASVIGRFRSLEEYIERMVGARWVMPGFRCELSCVLGTKAYAAIGCGVERHSTRLVTALALSEGVREVVFHMIASAVAAGHRSVVANIVREWSTKKSAAAIWREHKHYQPRIDPRTFSVFLSAIHNDDAPLLSLILSTIYPPLYVDGRERLKFYRDLAFSCVESNARACVTNLLTGHGAISTALHTERHPESRYRLIEHAITNSSIEMIKLLLALGLNPVTNLTARWFEARGSKTLESFGVWKSAEIKTLRGLFAPWKEAMSELEEEKRLGATKANKAFIAEQRRLKEERRKQSGGRPMNSRERKLARSQKAGRKANKKK